jgi:hypothetical protein
MMAEGANNNQSNAAAEKMAVMAVTATAIAVGTNNNQLKAVVEKTVVLAMVVAMAAATTVDATTILPLSRARLTWNLRY